MMTQTLYRPVGKTELQLIEATNFQRFPPRLTWQPIFYPVLNFEYAAQIAEEWNTQDQFSSYAGFVLKFEVEANYLTQFPVQTVGGTIHKELWIPAEDLEVFNDHIIGKIEVVASFFGELFRED